MVDRYLSAHLWLVALSFAVLFALELARLRRQDRNARELARKLELEGIGRREARALAELADSLERLAVELEASALTLSVDRKGEKRARIGSRPDNPL